MKYAIVDGMGNESQRLSQKEAAEKMVEGIQRTFGAVCEVVEVEDDAPRIKAKPPVVLTDLDGNAFAIMAAANKAMREFYKDKEERNAIMNAYQKEATSGNYDHLIQTTMRFCEVI